MLMLENKENGGSLNAFQLVRIVDIHGIERYRRVSMGRVGFIPLENAKTLVADCRRVNENQIHAEFTMNI
jgi:hypothetical protein